jgi:DNA-binding beta-propeller fold protein YncE
MTFNPRCATYHRIRRAISIALLASATFVGGALLLAGTVDEARVVGSARTPTGQAQLVSFEPFEDEICLMPDALNTAPQYSRYHFTPGQGTGGRQQESRPIHVDRAPARFIKDPWPAWSAVAVNPEHDIVILTDENLHRIVEYHRLDNTPPNVEMTEPRRVIAGVNTQTEMLCGAYVDPRTLEVYVTNNDTVNWMPVFSREARGNVAPDRMLATPHRAWGIAADELRQELYMTIQSPSAVVVYRKAAAGAEEPLRILEGDATELADARGIAVDAVNDLIAVINHGHRRFYGGEAVSTLTGTWEEWVHRAGFPVQTGLRQLPRRYRPGLGRFELPSINIYARGARGNTAPLRVIKGPRTQLNWPSHVAIHEERQEIFVANDADDSILVFRLSDHGDVAPTRVIKGPRTALKNPTGIALDRVHGELWVVNMGNYAATVYPLAANGDTAPVRTIRGGPAGRIGLMIGNPGAVAYDTKRQEILVPN